MAESKADQLRRVPLFSQCSKRELQFLATQMDDVSIGVGRTLLTEGNPTDAFYLILRGEVEVSIKGRSRGRLKPGDFFGEIGMLDRGPATATVVTTTPVEALVLSHAQFRDAIKANEGIALKVMATMAQRLRANTHG